MSRFFPSNPILNQIYQIGTNIYTYNGSAWDVTNASAGLSGFSGSSASGYSGFSGVVGSSGFSGLDGGPAMSMAVSQNWCRWPAGIATRSLSTNTAQYTPLWINTSTNFDRVAVKTGASVTASGYVGIAVYNNTNNKPSTLVASLGGINFTTANTVYTITINLTLARGFYWIASGMHSGTATWRGHGTYGEFWWWPRSYGDPSVSSTNENMVYPFGGSASGFADNPTISYNGWDVMCVWLRKS